MNRRRNRDKLMNTNQYDLLCRMNDKIMSDEIGHIPCVLELIDEKPENLKLLCEKHMDCHNCIQEYLNSEESYGGIS